MATQIRKVIPLLNRVLVKRLDAPKKSPGGIYLPEAKESDLTTAQVLAIGPGAFDDHGHFREVTVRAGQTVLLPPYGGSAVEVQQEKLYLYKDSEILGVLE